MLHFFDPACEEFRPLTREDPSAFAPPPAFGPFRVLHQVGVGALGPVFRSYEPTRDRLIAVKVFRLDITPEQAQALADELSRAAEASLFHPSIVEPIAAGLEGTVAYRAEEYVAAESLDVAMRHYAPAPIEKILPFLTQLAGAIDFARAAGVGHGALHPRDVFITPDEARAGGFGVVEALERVGLRAPVRRPYTAPERIDGGTWGTPADVFSLAAIAFELLTARRPAGIGLQIGGLSGADLGRHEGAVHTVLARAMDVDPAERYPSALAFASALEGASRGVVDAGSQIGAVSSPEAAVQEQARARDDRETLARINDEDERVGDERDRRGAAPALLPIPARVVQPEGEEAFTDPEPVPDVDAERDEDEAYHALLEAERRERDALESEQERALLDDEEDEAEADRYVDVRDDDDLPLRGDDPEPIDAQDRAAQEDASAPRVVVAPPARHPYESSTYSVAPLSSAAAGASVDRVLGPEFHARETRETTRMLPLALTLIAGLLLGFAAGYFVGGRDLDARQSASSTAAPQATAPVTPGAPQGRGREWSEQAVTPPQGSRGAQAAQPSAVAPPVPSESAAASGGPPPRAASPTPAATRGRLVVQSTPARAGVTVNGRWRGRTPLTLDNLPLGNYAIRVVQRGFDTGREQVTLSSTQPSQTVSVRLQRVGEARAEAETEPVTSGTNGVLFVDSRPRGAQVFVDGRLVGTTPLRVPELRIGSHVVRLELTGHRRWSTSASISAARETRVTGSLDPIQ